MTRPSVRTHERNTRCRLPQRQGACAVGLAVSERPVGVEPTWTGLQPVAAPSGSSLASFSVLARSRAWSSTFARSRANPPHSEDVRYSAPRRGIEPRLAVPKTAVLSGTPARLLRRVSRPGLEPGPGASEAPMRSATPSGRTVEPTTGLAPASSGLQDRCLSVRPRRQARARGVKPRAAGLESACSPRSTLVYCPRPRGPGAFGAATTSATPRSSTLR